MPTRRALKSRSQDYVDAIVYKGLLLRLQATVEKDVQKQQDLLEATRQRTKKASDLKRAETKTGGTGART